jgi:hypothetical protein
VIVLDLNLDCFHRHRSLTLPLRLAPWSERFWPFAILILLLDLCQAAIYHRFFECRSGRLQDGRGKLFRAKSIGKGGIWYEDVRMNDWLRPKQTFQDRPQNGLSWSGASFGLLPQERQPSML